MAVKARITAKKSNGLESHVERTSTTAIFIDASNGIDRVSLIVRADGRIEIEVKNGGAVTQYLNLTRGYTTIVPPLVDGTVVTGLPLAVAK